MLRFMADTIGRFKPPLGRRAAPRWSWTVNLTFDTTPIHHAYPDLPATSLTDLLATPSSEQACPAPPQERPSPLR